MEPYSTDFDSCSYAMRTIHGNTIWGKPNNNDNKNSKYRFWTLIPK